VARAERFRGTPRLTPRANFVYGASVGHGVKNAERPATEVSVPGVAKRVGDRDRNQSDGLSFEKGTA